jgi:MFS family permease
MRSGLISRRGDFRRLWVGNAVSQVGTQVSMLAVPLLAVLTLHASTFQIGALTAAENAAFLLLGLPAGAWVDRLRRRPVLIAGDVVRAALLASLPLAAALRVLTLAQLYTVVVAVGVGTVFFDVAYQSYLPSRQTLCPDHLLGRMSATMRFMIWGALPVGGLIGGALGTAIGLRATLWVSAFGGLLAVGWLVASPLRDARAPDTVDTVAA